jgi:hypothetical protein
MHTVECRIRIQERVRRISRNQRTTEIVIISYTSVYIPTYVVKLV